ncbi:MAG: hypothetical protein PHI97_00810 [Desulfobulbus sp.]|nr:hypothetical protein [Desulfobulbus sp.]
MAEPENIESFNRICVALFDKLYSAFPVPVEINMKDISMNAIPQDASFNDTWDDLMIGGEVINFLAEEGFLTHKGSLLNESQYLQVRLTMKGLAVLGYVPAPLEKQEPLISKIRSVMGGGLKEAGSETIRQLVSQVFNLALAAAPTVSALMSKP